MLLNTPIDERLATRILSTTHIWSTLHKLKTWNFMEAFIFYSSFRNF